MTLNIQLTPEQEARLEANVARSGFDLETYAVRRLLGDEDDVIPAGESMYDRLMALGVIGAVEGKPRKDGRNRSELEGFPSDID